jgi:hypothetical protein
MKPCAYGLMQAIEYPADVMDLLIAESKLPPNTKSVIPVAFLSSRRQPNGEIRALTEVQKATIKSVLGVNGDANNIYNQLNNSECLGPDTKYNPFNFDDSICWGTLKLRLMLDSAIRDIQGREIEYGFVDDRDSTKIDQDKVRVAEYYIALSKYGGEWNRDNNDWLGSYKIYLDKTKANVWCTHEGEVYPIDPMGTAKNDCGPVVGGDYTFKSNNETRCYGQKDFLRFMERCIYYNLNNKGTVHSGDDNYKRDSAIGKIKWYKAMTIPYKENDVNTGCKHSTCPSPTLSGLYKQCNLMRDPLNAAKLCWDVANNKCDEDCAFRATCITLKNPDTNQSCWQGGTCVESCLAKNQ